MTNKEAIKLIQGIEEDGRNVTSEHVEALHLAIKALEKRPQGEWSMRDEYVGGEYVTSFYHINCPCDELETPFYLKRKTRFCPNCGTPMKKG